MELSLWLRRFSLRYKSINLYSWNWFMGWVIMQCNIKLTRLGNIANLGDQIDSNYYVSKRFVIVMQIKLW